MMRNDSSCLEGVFEVWRVSLCVQELYHPPKFLGILGASPECQNTTGRPVLSRGFCFYLVFGFSVGLVNGSPRSVRSTCEPDTGAGWLDTVVVGEVDELEEDVG